MCEETLREAVRRIVEKVKHTDLEKYKVKRCISFKALQGKHVSSSSLTLYTTAR